MQMGMGIGSGDAAWGRLPCVKEVDVRDVPVLKRGLLHYM